MTPDLVPFGAAGCAAPLSGFCTQNSEAAKRAVPAIRQGAKVLEQQPGLGRPVEDMDDEFRDWIIDFGDSGYVAHYRVDQQSITILAGRYQGSGTKRYRLPWAPALWIEGERWGGCRKRRGARRSGHGG